MKRDRNSLTAWLLAALMLLPAVPGAAIDFETLRPGHQGEQVRAMQSALRHLGYSLGVDGKYGPQTEETVTAFQRVNRLKPDGLAGNLTLNELYRQASQFMPEDQSPPTSTQLPASTDIPISRAPAAPDGGKSATVYTANRGSLNLRSRPSRGNTTIAQLPFGTQVAVLSVQGAWTQVIAQGQHGYVQSSFLRFGTQPANPVALPQPSRDETPAPSDTPPPIVEQTATSSEAMVYTVNRGSLNLRDRASYAGKVLYQIPYRTVVQVLSRKGTWSQVSYRGTVGYVVDSFLTYQISQTTQAPAGTTQPAQTESPQAPVQGMMAFVSTQNRRTLNFRSTPSQGNNIIGQLPNGAALSVLSRGETWCEVEYNGRRGFVMSSFLRFDTKQTQEPAPAQEVTPTPTVSPTPSPQPSQAPLFSRTLRLNDSGEDVSLLQERLIALKYTVSRTGVYDSMTREAVTHFQLQNGLTSDGIFGSASSAVLLSGNARSADSLPLSYKTLRIDNRDPADGSLSAMQKALSDLGYPLTVNGRFDIPTHQAVVAFQQRNGLPISGIATPITQSTLYSGSAKPYSTPVESLDAELGKGGGPSTSQVKLLHWFNEIKPRVGAGQRVTVYHPSSDTSFTLRFYSLGNHADSEPATWQDTQLMNRAFGTPSWNINTVYVKLPDGQWTLAAMHNRPHLTGAITNNGFGGHLCVHFLRDMDEVLRNDPDYGASNQRAIRKAWMSMTGETVN